MEGFDKTVGTWKGRWTYERAIVRQREQGCYVVSHYYCEKDYYSNPPHRPWRFDLLDWGRVIGL